MKKVVKDPYIWEVPNSLTDEFCDNLVKKFEEDPTDSRYVGVTGNGLDPEMKVTFDLVISNNHAWIDEDHFFCEKVGKLTNDYIKYIQETVPDVDITNGITQLNDSGYHIQKYEPNKGFYTWHNDFHFDADRGQRFLTFIWYLNTVDEGGETEFTNGVKVKPEKGKVVMFPATWTYTHRGCIPYSNEKYILTGWIYNGWVDTNRYKNKKSSIF